MTRQADAPDDGAAEPADADVAVAPDGTRYDDIAEGYVHYWAPVLHDAAIAVLDHLQPAIEATGRTGTPVRLLDVGAGTGTLSLAALRRWPAVHVTAIDPSAGMLEEARRAATATLGSEAGSCFRTAVASADALPDELGRFDAAMSSFVLQLVPNRAAALREIRRVLQPGATFAWVTWLQGERSFEPDRIKNAVLDEFGFDPPEPEARPGDLASVQAAALGMRRAGFRDVRAWAGECIHPWDARGYLDFLTRFDEQSLFDDLARDERAEIEGRILAELERLAPEQLTLRLPIVYVTGRSPA